MVEWLCATQILKVHASEDAGAQLVRRRPVHYIEAPKFGSLA
jgi:hypothetical protein